MSVGPESNVVASGGSCSRGGTCRGEPEVEGRVSAGGHCNGGCSGKCGSCGEIARGEALNWGRMQASAVPGASEFWRQATIFDTLLRTTGEVIPDSLLSVVSALHPLVRLSKFQHSNGVARVSGEFPPVSPTTEFARMNMVVPYSMSEADPSPAWWSPAIKSMSEFPLASAFVGADAWPHLQDGTAPACLQEALLADAPQSLVDDTPYEDDAYDDKGCVSLWKNTFWSDGNGSCAIGRIHVDCKNTSCAGECKPRSGGAGCECVKGTDRDPGNSTPDDDGGDGGGSRGGGEGRGTGDGQGPFDGLCAGGRCACYKEVVLAKQRVKVGEYVKPWSEVMSGEDQAKAARKRHKALTDCVKQADALCEPKDTCSCVPRPICHAIENHSYDMTGSDVTLVYVCSTAGECGIPKS